MNINHPFLQIQINIPKEEEEGEEGEEEANFTSRSLIEKINNVLDLNSTDSEAKSSTETIDLLTKITNALDELKYEKKNKHSALNNEVDNVKVNSNLEDVPVFKNFIIPKVEYESMISNYDTKQEKNYKENISMLSTVNKTHNDMSISSLNYLKRYNLL